MPQAPIQRSAAGKIAFALRHRAVELFGIALIVFAILAIQWDARQGAVETLQTGCLRGAQRTALEVNVDRALADGHQSADSFLLGLDTTIDVSEVHVLQDLQDRAAVLSAGFRCTEAFPNASFF